MVCSFFCPRCVGPPFLLPFNTTMLNRRQQSTASAPAPSSNTPAGKPFFLLFLVSLPIVVALGTASCLQNGKLLRQRPKRVGARSTRAISLLCDTPLALVVFLPSPSYPIPSLKGVTDCFYYLLLIRSIPRVFVLSLTDPTLPLSSPCLFFEP